MHRTLRVMEPKRLPAIHNARTTGPLSLVWWGVVAVLLQFMVPYVVLDAVGIPTVSVKLHPATILVIIVSAYALMNGKLRLQQRFRDSPGLVLFVLVTPVLAVYSMVFTGFSGSAVYAENYLSAGLLALMLEQATARQKRLLAAMLIMLCVFNVIVGLVESLTYTNWFPLVLDPDLKQTDLDVDFRANAFYNHPLTASLMTSMAVFLLYAMRMKFILAAPVLMLFLVGLLSFGGRSALAVTLVISVLTALYTLLVGIVRRNLKLSFVMALVSAAIVIPLVLTFIVTQTTIAERIINTLYFDESAQARQTQWAIFRYLSLQNWLFGISHDDLAVLKYQIGLGGIETDIENFWMLMMLNLGAIGFTLFVAVFVAFLGHLAVYARNLNGWLLVIAAIIVDSGSNSLGVKSSDLFIEVAFIVAMSGYAEYTRTTPVATTPKPAPQMFAKPQALLGYDPPGRPRGLRMIAARGAI